MIGSHVARLFATHQFSRIALFARSTSNLSTSSAFISAAAPSASVHVYNADVTDPANLTNVLEKAIVEVGTPEVVVYNAARIQYGMFGDYKEEDIVEDFKVPSLGLYTSAKVLLPRLQSLAKEKPEAHPCLFVTSSPVIHQPFAAVFSLSMAKAAQASLVKLLAEQAKDVVHVALVIAAWGPVTMDEPVNNPANIATRFWDLWEQEKGKWDFEIEVK
jgi:short-subunit dehydrogenase